MTEQQANIWLPQESIASVVQILRRLLGNSFVLYVMIKQFHWNIRGTHFFEYHEKFDEMAGDLLPVIDDTAEKIRSLWVTSPGTMQEFLADASIDEVATSDIEADMMLNKLLNVYEQLIQEIRKDIATCEQVGDAGNADFLTGLIQDLEKTARMLRATVA